MSKSKKIYAYVVYSIPERFAKVEMPQVLPNGMDTRVYFLEGTKYGGIRERFFGCRYNSSEELEAVLNNEIIPSLNPSNGDRSYPINIDFRAALERFAQQNKLRLTEKQYTRLIEVRARDSR